MNISVRFQLILGYTVLIVLTALMFYLGSANTEKLNGKLSDILNINAKRIFLSLYDEIFLNVTDTPFDQNRLYAALGYKFNKSLSMQAGYLRHRLGPNNFNRLQLALFINSDLSKAEVN